jgi:hypothetical protein
MLKGMNLSHALNHNIGLKNNCFGYFCRGVSSAAITALRELSPLLSASELLRALQIHSRTITSDLQTSVETW